MSELGRLEDLPASYVEELKSKNLVPLWPSLRQVMPPLQPKPRTEAVCWHYQDVKPLLLKAGELTPIEKAERRVLVLANPGHGLENMCASSVMYLGLQLLLPGEWAPVHRHTPNAVRMIVEGEGAYTTVNGDECPMHRGDLILTPTGMWHEHGHRGDKPVVWLDVLDLPLVYYIEAAFVEEGNNQEQKITKVSSKTAYGAGIAPVTYFERNGNTSYPLMRYSWEEAKKSLNALAEKDAEIVQIAYLNPETGTSCQKILGFSAIMLRPGETVKLPKRSTAMVFHAIEGHAQVRVDDKVFDLTDADTCVAPCFAEVDLINKNNEATYLFVADEQPLQEKIGVYSVRQR